MRSQKEIRLLKEKKARDAEGLFLIEGIKMVEETPSALLEQLVMTADFAATAAGQALTARAENEHIPVLADLSEQHFKQLADTKSPQGILAVAKKPVFSLEESLSQKSGPLLILDTLQDPGNLGTILRTAEAFACAGVVLSGACADVYQPKVVRATMGSLYRVPHFVIEDVQEAVLLARNAGLVTYASYLHEGAGDHTAADLAGRCAIVVGNESKGLSPEIVHLCDRAIRIPMAGEIESLNAAMAAGVLLYEAWRQRSRA